uniref:ubiquitinyl hydrolase 1 n=1 Tax=Aegilops tauschii subsp. strangulata TaxID=200361 RepID=A0A453MZ37_AEGTS
GSEEITIWKMSVMHILPYITVVLISNASIVGYMTLNLPNLLLLLYVQWCFWRVAPACRSTDHVMMVALARALEVPLRVERVRGGYDPDIYTGPGVPRPRVTLLYSANHYEIIYPRAPSAESSSHQASQREHAADQGSSQQTTQRKHPADQSSSHQASQREDHADQS